MFGLIAGALSPDAGRSDSTDGRIDGLTPDRIFRAGLARTFQIPRPFPQMTVFENVMLAPLHQAGERFWNNWIALREPCSAGEANPRARHGGAGFHRPCGKASELAGQLSGGQQKLLELARVLMTEPKLILLDEPAAGVNPALLEYADREDHGAACAAASASSIIEHNMDMVMSICDPDRRDGAGPRHLRGRRGRACGANPRVLDAYLGDVAA